MRKAGRKKKKKKRFVGVEEHRAQQARRVDAQRHLDDSRELLGRMFPSVDAAVVDDVWEGAHNVFDAAVEMLRELQPTDERLNVLSQMFPDQQARCARALEAADGDLVRVVDAMLLLDVDGDDDDNDGDGEDDGVWVPAPEAPAMVVVPAPTSFREVMAMEEAVQASCEAIVRDNQRVNGAPLASAWGGPKTMTMGAQVKLQRLQDVFPMLDRHVIEAAFVSCGCRSDVTTDMLAEAHPDTVIRLEALLSADVVPDLLPLQRGRQQGGGGGGDHDRDEEEEDRCLLLQDADADAEHKHDGSSEDFYEFHRAEAAQHWERCRELYREAAEVSARGGHSAHAADLVARGRVERDKALAANRVAMQNIFAAVNGRNRSVLTHVDLHGLHADEAVQVVKRLLALRRRKGVDRQSFVIVTGVGNGSERGARILPAVVQLLWARGVGFHVSGGQIELTVE